MGEISLGTIYEMNKSALKSMPALSYENLTKALQELEDWLNTPVYESCCDLDVDADSVEKDRYGNYYMLLNNELHDYSIFRLGSQYQSDVRKINVKSMISDLQECFYNRYCQLLSINQGDDEYSYEIWVRREEGYSENDTGEVYCYHLFPYDGGIMDYGRNN